MIEDKTMYREKISGVLAPVTTPFDEKGNVLLNKMASNIQKLNQTRLRGYWVLGTNGEARGLSMAEQKEVLKIVVKTASPDKVIMAGTGSESTNLSIELCHQAAELGAHFGFLLHPYYFSQRMSNQALINYFTQVAEKSPIPVLLYNNPGVTTINISTTVIREVSSHPNIVGMKDSSAGNLSAYILNARPGFCILAGSVEFFFTGLLMGATGGSLAWADPFPEQCCKLYDLGVAGKLEEGRALQYQLMDLSQKIHGKFGIPGLKAAMDFAGFYGGPARSPLAPLTAEEKAEIKERLAASESLK
jgi:4-hydroxy-2-oxoglutarate aldolase